MFALRRQWMVPTALQYHGSNCTMRTFLITAMTTRQQVLALQDPIHMSTATVALFPADVPLEQSTTWCAVALADNSIVNFFLTAAAGSDLFAHQLIWALNSEAKPPEEAFNPTVKR